MPSAQSAVVAAPASRRLFRSNGLLDRYFYFAMSLLFAAIVVLGFSRSINDNLIHATVPRPGVLWLHAGVFSGWIVFFILQSLLVRTHRVRLHRTLGWFGTVLGASMVGLGVMTALAMGQFRVTQLHEAGASLFEIVSFSDMFLFASLFSMAIYWRKKPQLHRRLIFMATCGLLDAAFGRFDYILNHHLFYYCVDAVILLGVTRDLLIERRIHSVYRVALPAIVAVQAATMYIFLDSPAWWVRTAHQWMG